MKFYAHTLPSNAPPSSWEPLFDGLSGKLGHLNKTADACSKFARDMFPKTKPAGSQAHAWGNLLGLWHDLGKFASEWQDYLASKADPHKAEIQGKLDHSSAGAQHAVRRAPLLGHLLAYPIAGHHSGLLDGSSNGSCQLARLKKSDLPDWSTAPAEILELAVPDLPSFLSRDAYSLGFFTRMIFSCLVDADFLATEAFMNPDQSVFRNQAPTDVLASISRLIDEHIDRFPKPQSGDSVNTQRRVVIENCRAAANLPPGLFSLTVPTGGGKTLSSLSFALHHALTHGQRRIIYVAPFTSIIEQNAEVIRNIVAPLASENFEPLIEHHSALDPEKESTVSRLATENWDAPLIITTAVQFYESLFAAKTSRCRKIHNIANAVVILDEAQSLPVDYLSPCLRALQELCDHYCTTVVLCTATQPAIQYTEDFKIGLKGCREIINDTRSLFAALKRVEIKNLGDISDADLVSKIKSEQQVLCIVNRRNHAQKIFRSLGEVEENFHLSALMCPEHRSRMLAAIRNRLRSGLPARVVSTQLIEAGVDVDFPVVYRALAGIDSIAQAAGRCNRNGSLSSLGQTYVFRPEDQSGEAYFRETAQIAHQLLDLHEDLLGRQAVHHYFDLYYYQQKNRWDSKRIIDDFRLDNNNRDFPFHFQFSEVAKKFRLIDDWQVPLIIPFDEHARELIRQLRNPNIPLHRRLLRNLQRFTVQISPRMRDENIRSIEPLRDGQFHALISTDLHYSQHFGLVFDPNHSSNQTLIC